MLREEEKAARQSWHKMDLKVREKKVSGTHNKWHSIPIKVRVMGLNAISCEAHLISFLSQPLMANGFSLPSLRANVMHGLGPIILLALLIVSSS